MTCLLLTSFTIGKQSLYSCLDSAVTNGVTIIRVSGDEALASSVCSCIQVSSPVQDYADSNDEVNQVHVIDKLDSLCAIV